ncbi:hypothetical protein D915_007430 [Fasciola hepatica]|uniref:Uncharacterized protein n=1 Tax=Fasciola hepatica TaxID=6192 RepID=A0A4E0R472_FASHE|nr:hypothetical protein D915_007430 [Fasciola hepatica]
MDCTEPSVSSRIVFFTDVPDGFSGLPTDTENWYETQSTQPDLFGSKLLPVLSVEEVESFFAHQPSPDPDQSQLVSPRPQWKENGKSTENDLSVTTEHSTQRRISSPYSGSLYQSGRCKSASWPRTVSSNTPALISLHSQRRQRRWKTAARAMIPFSLLNDP